MKEDSLDKLFKGYFKSQRPKRARGDVSIDRIECSDTLYSIAMPASAEKETCPDITILGAYIEGALDDEERSQIAAHIKKCKKCRESIESASITLDEMRENRLEKTPDDLSSDTSSRISDSTRKTPPKE